MKYKVVVLYGISLAVLMILVRWLQFGVIIFDHSMELYIAAIALVFLGLGVWLALKLTRPKTETIVVEKEVIVHQNVGFVFNDKAFNELSMSNRELEVLKLMSLGLSNKEIGEKLFISESTIKTHASSVFEKMDVRRRTQAIEKAKRLNIIE